MSKYLRCFVLMFVCLLSLELMVTAFLFAVHPDVPVAQDIFSLPLPSLLVWLLTQLMIAYLLCVLLSRTDSTTALHFVIFAAIIGFIVAVVQYNSAAIDSNYWQTYLALIPISTVKFAIAGWVFAKLQ